MKKGLLMLIVLVFTFTLLTAYKLHIHFRDNEIISFKLDEIRSITFCEADTLIINYHYPPNRTVKFHASVLKMIEFSDDVSVDEMVAFLSNIPIRFLKNQPNPFNPNTTISFEITQSGHAAVEIYNAKGQKVKTLYNGELQTGNHSMIYNGRNEANRRVASGVNFYRVTINESQKISKMLMIK